MEDSHGPTEKGKRNRGGGGKLSRSETVTVRLDPKLNYLCELAARAQRRTKSSFIEWAIDHALGFVEVPSPTQTGETIAQKANELWDVDESDRLAQLAFYAPVLMTHDEQLMWRLVETNGSLWKGNFTGMDEIWRWDSSNPHNFRWQTFRDHFETFRQVAEGRRPKLDLPTWQVKRPQPAAFDTDLDDDVPF
jgi:predicted transcriptional regulator